MQAETIDTSALQSMDLDAFKLQGCALYNSVYAFIKFTQDTKRA